MSQQKNALHLSKSPTLLLVIFQNNTQDHKTMHNRIYQTLSTRRRAAIVTKKN